MYFSIQNDILLLSQIEVSCSGICYLLLLWELSCKEQVFNPDRDCCWGGCPERAERDPGPAAGSVRVPPAPQEKLSWKLVPKWVCSRKRGPVLTNSLFPAIIYIIFKELIKKVSNKGCLNLMSHLGAVVL